MTYATEIVQDYRRALQALWNGHFWRDEAWRDIETARDFKALQLALFRTLVTRRIEPMAAPPVKVFGPSYRLIPRQSQAYLALIQVCTTEPPHRVWQSFSGSFVAAELDLVPLDFFDWNENNWRDFRYFRVQIDRFDKHPELAGYEGLVDVLEADIIFNPDSA